MREEPKVQKARKRFDETLKDALEKDARNRKTLGEQIDAPPGYRDGESGDAATSSEARLDEVALRTSAFERRSVAITALSVVVVLEVVPQTRGGRVERGQRRGVVVRERVRGPA